ncbi:MAG TPA: DegT/DnrJ/EryC1/StrS family aminotransferase [Candidatus Omnitrophota bacterium]|nr:DegT/DnrJ/EryC1/StrS family aminotransferase [Candidatus Omnitrophota bacterium]
MIPLVDLKRQYKIIKKEIDESIQSVIESTQFIQGQNVKAFEKEFAAISGTHHGVATSSGTTALHLALTALRIGPGAEVITVPNTFIATTEAISQARAKIKFVDIDEKTYNMDVEKLEAAITEKTKAIIPVHIYGQPADMEPILAIAKKHHLKVIADAAQAHLSSYKDKPIGQFGDAIIYSFYPAKNLGAYGDAGMVLTNNDELASKMRMMADHGRTGKYEHLIEGFNYRMDEIQAAILRAKLKYLLKWTHRRRQIAKNYDMLLEQLDVIVPYVAEYAKHVYHLYVIRVKDRQRVLDVLAKEEISAGIHYPIPLHLQKAYQHLGYSKGSFPVAERCAQEILSLPMFPEMIDKEVYKVASTLSIACGRRTGTFHHASR